MKAQGNNIKIVPIHNLICRCPQFKIFFRGGCMLIHNKMCTKESVVFLPDNKKNPYSLTAF
jgi:hypothetical protein